MMSATESNRRTAVLTPEKFLVVAAACAYLIITCEAFVVTPILTSAASRTSPIKPTVEGRPFVVVPCAKGDNDGDGEEDDRGAVEAERRRLEAIMGSGSSAPEESPKIRADGSSSPLPPDVKEQLANPPPLTTIGRERLQTEISLIESLRDGDEAVGKLWTLWYHERGPGPAAELAATDLLTARGPSSFAAAEDLLRQLIAREGIYWTEAVNRLATLLFLQGRFKESKEACEVVLAVKPWHFGALSGIVMVCQGLNDADGVINWAGKRMPPVQAELSPIFGDGVVRETRTEWVTRMVKEARKRLHQAEKGVLESFMDCDASNENDGIYADDEDGSWQ